MRTSSFSILRVGVGISFLWIGILILRDPLGWGQLILPWAAHLIPGSLTLAMQQTAVLDIIIGFLLIIGVWTWLAGLIGALHLIVVLVTTGISDITCRDIGLLAAAIAIMLESKPFGWLPAWVPGRRA